MNPTDLPRTPASARLLITAIAWALGAAALLFIAALTAPRFLGGGSYTVVTGSMRDSVEVGDQVIAMPRSAGDIRVGDIVAFKDPEGSDRLFQHRVQRVAKRGRDLEVVTMGDANTGYERWRVPADAQVDKVVAVIPKAGYLVALIAKPAVRGLIAASSWLALLAIVLFSLWRPRVPEVAR